MKRSTPRTTLIGDELHQRCLAATTGDIIPIDNHHGILIIATRPNGYRALHTRTPIAAGAASHPHRVDGPSIINVDGDTATADGWHIDSASITETQHARLTAHPETIRAFRALLHELAASHPNTNSGYHAACDQAIEIAAALANTRN